MFCTFAQQNSKVQTTMRLFPLLIALLLAACGGSPEVDALLAVADSLSGVKPDSALRLLQQQEAGVPHWSKGQRMRHALLTAKAMNKAYVPLTADSLMTVVADYYDRHGTPNEQMEAHYLLGCTYRDLGEAPAALAAYQDAIDRADTLAADCDFNTLSCIYGQIAWQYHNQLLLSDEIEAHYHAIRYNLLAGDTLSAIYERKMIAGDYILQNKRDSAEIILNDVMRLYQAKGHTQEMIRTSPMLMVIYSDDPKRQKELKQLIDAYETQSGYFDEHHELLPSKRQFYYHKGKYYEMVGMLDSAEYFYRKIYRSGMKHIEMDPMYRGLLSVFQKRHQADSIAKYAQLYCAANDSSIIIKDQTLTAQMTASHRYNRYQKQARENERKARKAEMALIIFIIVAIFVLERFRLKRRATKRLLYEKAKKLMQTQEELSYLKGKLQKLTDTVCDKDATIHQQEAAIESLSDIIARKEEELAASLSELSNNHNALFLQKRETDETKRKLTASPAYQLLQDKDRRGDKLEAEDWEAVSQLVKQTFPTFYAFVTARGNGTNTKEQQLCLLFRLYVKPRRASLLIGVAPSMVTKLSKSVLQKLFNTDGTGKDLAERLQMLR